MSFMSSYFWDTFPFLRHVSFRSFEVILTFLRYVSFRHVSFCSFEVILCRSWFSFADFFVLTYMRIIQVNTIRAFTNSGNIFSSGGRGKSFTDRGCPRVIVYFTVVVNRLFFVFVFSPAAVVPVQLSVTAVGEWTGVRACDASWVALGTLVLISFFFFVWYAIYMLTFFCFSYFSSNGDYSFNIRLYQCIYISNPALPMSASFSFPN